MNPSAERSTWKNPVEAFLIARMGLFLVALPAMIRALKIQALMRRVTPAKERRLEGSLTADRITYLCERMLRLFQRTGYKYSCMRRSIVLYHFLRAYGVPVVIHFGAKWAGGAGVGARREGATGAGASAGGARKEGAALAGHSWVTLGDTILLDSPENVNRFSRFFSFPEGRKEAGGTGEPMDKDLAAQERISFD